MDTVTVVVILVEMLCCFDMMLDCDAFSAYQISFTVNPGEFVAIVGPSGGGKTSCVNLLERFYEPSKGRILIDDREISTFDHNTLHSQVSVEVGESRSFAWCYCLTHKFAPVCNFGISLPTLFTKTNFADYLLGTQKKHVHRVP